MPRRWLAALSPDVKRASGMAIALLLLAALCGWWLTGVVRHRAFVGAEERAQAQISPLEQRLRGDALSYRVEGRRARGLRKLARPIEADGDLLGLRIWNSRQQIVYSDGLRLRATSRPPAAIARALRGQRSSIEARTPAARRSDRAVVVYLPVREKRGARPSGVVEAYLPYAAVGGPLSSDKRKVWLAVLLAFALVLVGVLHLIRTMSRRLQHDVASSEHRALHDPLTGFPNRTLFRRLADEALLRRAEGTVVGLVLIDLDRFKDINDALGHFNGDLVIERAAKRIASVLRDGDVVGRLGGDEFALLLPALPAPEAVGSILDRIKQELTEPFTVAGLALEVEASMGVAVCPYHATDVPDLIQAADVAMYAAKDEHADWKFYSPDQHRHSPQQVGLVAELRRAVEEDELVLHYQPKAALATGAVEGVEALVRWNHRHQGLVFPDEFIPLAEHTSVIRPLTLHLLEKALAQVVAWEEEGIRLSVAVNLSSRMLLDESFPREAARLLFQLKVPPDRLELEVTESSIMQDPRRAKALLDRLHNLGVRLSLDDFGTGYSSLVSLRRLPFNSLKIDKGFVIGMESNEDDATIVRSTTQLGKSLGLEVVAEGVESRSSWDTLAGFGCDYAQGYYLSKPLEPEKFMTWLNAYREVVKRPSLAGFPPAD